MRIPRFLFAASLMLIAPSAFAGGEGETPVNLLTRVESTRAQAFGGGAVAVGNDATLVWVNPAASAGAAQGSVTAGGNRGFFGDLTGQAIVTAPVRRGMLTAGLLYYDAGEVENYTSTGLLWRTRPQQDVMATAGYARALNTSVSSGATFKYLQSRVAGVRMHSLSGDGGVQVRLGRSLKLGAAVLNVGTPLEYRGAAVSLPTIVRVGGAAAFQFGSPGSAGRFDTVILVADLDHHPLEGLTAFRGGVEYQWRGMVALRAGVRTGSAAEIGTVAGGIGLRIGNYRLDWTIRHNALTDLPQTLSLTVHFGGAGPVVAPPASLLPGAPLVRPVPPPVSLPDQQPVILRPAQDSSATMPVDPVPLPPDGNPGGPVEDLNRQLDEMLRGEPKPSRP